MRKGLLIFASIIFVFGFILVISLRETRIEEAVIDEWNPISPSKLYPRWNYDANEFNITGYAFMSRARGDPEKRVFLESGTILELFLELNISASDVVRVRVGSISPIDNFDEYYSLQAAPKYSMTAIFDEYGTSFRNRVRVDGTDADFLDIINDGTIPVEVSGSVKLVGRMPKTSYPLLGPGILACLLGFLLLLYCIFSKPKRKFRRRRIGR
ncbi:MAG: hypothetical protein QW056_00045 [Candidatus Bathyarchaeia archaeon]